MVKREAAILVSCLMSFLLIAVSCNRRGPTGVEPLPTVTPAPIVQTLNLAFGTNRDGNMEISRTGSDGTGLLRLTDDPDYDGRPSWSADGQRIVFESHRDGDYEIYVMDADGGNQTRLTNSPGHDLHPAWSPDGSKVVFASNREGELYVYVMNADGSDPTRLVSVRSFGPSWSPDGTKIAFTASGGTYVIDPDGSNQALIWDGSSGLLFAPGYPDFPAWSPDGTRLAVPKIYALEGNYVETLLTINADGSDPFFLTYEVDSNLRAAWSPDGKRIAYTTGGGDIFIINADGSGKVNLTEDNEDYHYYVTWR